MVCNGALTSRLEQVTMQKPKVGVHAYREVTLVACWAAGYAREHTAAPVMTRPIQAGPRRPAQPMTRAPTWVSWLRTTEMAT